ncbi:hypothetical protein [Bacillus sp. AFS053548]|uniref:hypothetical protein n=1 Tax=Bacillus sp. AFS053548 TaxID=2033505 RepID=UPI000BFB7CE3|nr:hypothetical protein [Bacillus sp. AFS053548]PGM59542.1 hypothetical protein CN946_00965 [Bacillus sp. AFS053548]
MKKRYYLGLILTFCFFMSACSMSVTNKTAQPKGLDVLQTKEIKNWDIKLIPSLDHNKWVYDTSITYLGEKKYFI